MFYRKALFFMCLYFFLFYIYIYRKKSRSAILPQYFVIYILLWSICKASTKIYIHCKYHTVSNEHTHKSKNSRNVKFSGPLASFGQFDLISSDSHINFLKVIAKDQKKNKLLYCEEGETYREILF